MEEKYCEKEYGTTIREVCSAVDIQVFGDFQVDKRKKDGSVDLPSERNTDMLETLVAKELMKDKSDSIVKNHSVQEYPIRPEECFKEAVSKPIEFEEVEILKVSNLGKVDLCEPFKKMQTSNREDGLQIQEHRQEWNRYPNQELFTFEIPYNKEELVKNLKEEFEINEEVGDYIIYTPAKIRICKNS